MRDRAMTVPRAGCALAALAAVACSDATPAPVPRLEVLVRVESDGGEPIARAEVTAGGRTVAETGPSGVVVVSLRGRQSVREQVGVACPAGYDSPRDQRIRLGAFRRLDAPAERTVEMRFECRARTRTAVLVVQTEGAPGLPVRVHGETIVRTDERGLAHVPLRADRASTVRVTLDTSKRPKLRPHSPTATFALHDRDAVFVFTQTFAVDEPPPPKRPPRRARPKPKPKQIRPVRID